MGNWQRLLTSLQITGLGNKPLIDDEQFGPNTAEATGKFQQERGLLVSRVFDSATRDRAAALGFAPFIASKHQSVLWPKKRNVRQIIIHTMECLETRVTAAEDVALWFAGKTAYQAPLASAHYCVDVDSIVQCVRETDVAWHANNANPTSIGIEHAGYASQSTKDWADVTSLKILDRSAELAARIASRWSIPLTRLTPVELRAGKAGFAGHYDVTKAYGTPGGHVDPGPSFPWTWYLDRVQAFTT